jgi:ankyrin repeat protein
MELYLAIKSNNLSKVNYILNNDEHDLEKDEFLNDKITFISLAVINGNDKIVETLIDHHADINRLSYIHYIWPKNEHMFTSFEPALITASRHGKNKLKI